MDIRYYRFNIAFIKIMNIAHNTWGAYTIINNSVTFHICISSNIPVFPSSTITNKCIIIFAETYQSPSQVIALCLSSVSLISCIQKHSKLISPSNSFLAS